jgi:cell division protein FtsX
MGNNSIGWENIGTKDEDGVVRVNVMTSEMAIENLQKKLDFAIKMIKVYQNMFTDITDAVAKSEYSFKELSELAEIIKGLQDV